jgi:hypothetical protein
MLKSPGDTFRPVPALSCRFSIAKDEASNFQRNFYGRSELFVYETSSAMIGYPRYPLHFPLGRSWPVLPRHNEWW